MIYEVKGDILKSKAQAIAHGVAPGDHFNQGLAMSLREQWPSLYKDFRHFCQAQGPKSGTLWTWSSADGKRIINLLTQGAAEGHNSHPSRATIENVNHALKELRKLAEKENFKSIALPKLATGVGGLEWSEVQALIQKHLGDLNIPVYVYTTYQKDLEATEPKPH